ncbi:hypothetical protein MTR67_013030 [Solanum verrucosum]|uniref:Uncharacterized protein n=1 Tax=Solanum verrucosum TaxID=315347 RepID=A0AAF0TNF0_SOLVR|nr:hypothetical protein MTR67_013030 [Solanum verrucosum]
MFSIQWWIYLFLYTLQPQARTFTGDCDMYPTCHSSSMDFTKFGWKLGLRLLLNKLNCLILVGKYGVFCV